MAGDLVLLTGGTGFLGYTVLVDLLKSGFRVRLAARTQAKVDQVLVTPTIKALTEGNNRLSFVMVPDMSAPGAYDEAVQGVSYIVHVASAVPNFGSNEAWPEDERNGGFVARSRQASVNILNSAVKKGNGGIRRVVMTGSTVAIVPFGVFLNQPEVLEPTYGPDHRVPVPAPPYANDNEAYCAGKVAALKAAEDFIREQTPDFDLITILPSWIFGWDERATNVEQLREGASNSLLADVFLGKKKEWGLAGTAVLCSDVAKAHVKALDPAVGGNQSFIVSRPMEWQDAVSISNELYPQAVSSGLFRDDGSQPSIPLKLDTSKSEKVLEIEFAPFRKMVEEVAGQYVQLSEKH